MTETQTRAGLRNLARALPYVAATVGLALLGGGIYLNRQLAGHPRCDGCDPWHPLFVIAPIVLGTALVVGSWLLARR